MPRLTEVLPALTNQASPSKGLPLEMEDMARRNPPYQVCQRVDPPPYPITSGSWRIGEFQFESLPTTTHPTLCSFIFCFSFVLSYIYRPGPPPCPFCWRSIRYLLAIKDIELSPPSSSRQISLAIQSFLYFITSSIQELIDWMVLGKIEKKTGEEKSGWVRRIRGGLKHSNPTSSKSRHSKTW